MKTTKNDILFSLAVLSALIFMGTGIFWIYWIALFVACPFGIVAFVLWRIIRKDGRKRNIAIPIMLIAGLLLSLAMLLPWAINRYSVDCCF